MDRLYFWPKEGEKIDAWRWREIRYDHPVTFRELDPRIPAGMHHFPGWGHDIWWISLAVPPGCTNKIERMVLRF